MLTVRLINIRSADGIADYSYIVEVNGVNIAAGKVYGHRRADGWRKLVELLAVAKAPIVAVESEEGDCD